MARFLHCISLVPTPIVPTQWVFRGSAPLFPHLCPLSVPEVGVCGVYSESPLKRAIWNTLGLHAVLTTCLRFSSVLDDGCVACCLCQQAADMSAYKFTPRAVASPYAPQKPLVRKRARSGGAQWVRVQRHERGSRAKKPHTSRSQPPACTHREHHILSTTEALQGGPNSETWTSQLTAYGPCLPTQGGCL